MKAWGTPQRSKGFVATEYVLAVLIVMTTLLTPISNGKNVVELVSDAIKKEHAGYIYAASLSELPSVCCSQ